ncbi:MAG: M20 metallopeptidase family protein [Planctomycetota bacterium]|jgi:amidohydrolase
MNQTDFTSHIEPIVDQLVELRHDLHRHPELAYEEHRTAQRLVESLEAMKGMEIRKGVAGTGIIATLNGDKQGRCVALRADMDALPVQEVNQCEYRSQESGKMHACGHDGHMTCLIGAAQVLSQMADRIPGRIRFVFQPAEEHGAGARKMVEEGALDTVDAAFAMHGWPDAELGRIIVGTGPVLAAASAFSIELSGDGAHAAYPHHGDDVILAAAHLITRLQSVVSRLSDPIEPIVVSVCAIRGGDAHNVLPGSCELRGTLRALTQHAHDEAVGLLEKLVVAEAASSGVEGTMRIHESYPSLVNNAQAASLVRRTAAGWLGEGCVDSNPPPSMGGEDFAFFANRVPATMWRLGLRGSDDAAVPRLHQPNFDFPDRAIPIGVEMHCRVAMQFLADGLEEG